MLIYLLKKTKKEKVFEKFTLFLDLKLRLSLKFQLFKHHYAMSDDRHNLHDGLNKVTLVPGTAVSGKRGKGVGFYCSACNLTYKDSIQYLDHLNSKQHLYATNEQDISVKPATLQQVKARLAQLVKQKQATAASSASTFDIKERIAKFKESEIKEKERKRRAGKEKRERKKKRMKLVFKDDTSAKRGTNSSTSLNKQDEDMSKTMGFSSFH